MIGCTDIVAKGINVGWAFMPTLRLLRSFEQKPRACVPHTPYVGIGGFMRATACFGISRQSASINCILFGAVLD